MAPLAAALRRAASKIKVVRLGEEQTRAGWRPVLPEDIPPGLGPAAEQIRSLARGFLERGTAGAYLARIETVRPAFPVPGGLVFGENRIFVSGAGRVRTGPPNRAQTEALLRAQREAARQVAEVLRTRGVEGLRGLIFSVANTKTGVVSLNLPATPYRPAVCPAPTALCAAYCYAAKGRYPTVAVQRMYIANLVRILLDPEGWLRDAAAELTKRVLAQVRRGKPPVVRIHDSGDFFVPGLAVEWLRSLGVPVDERDVKLRTPEDYIRLVAALSDAVNEAVRRATSGRIPEVRFYAYTHAWVIPEIREAIRRHLLSRPYWTVYATVDPTMRGLTPEAIRRLKREGFRIAYTGFLPPAPDLGREAVLCPEYAAVLKGARPPSCAQCGICPYGRADVVFPLR